LIVAAYSLRRRFALNDRLLFVFVPAAFLRALSPRPRRVCLGRCVSSFPLVAAFAAAHAVLAATATPSQSPSASLHSRTRGVAHVAHKKHRSRSSHPTIPRSEGSRCPARSERAHQRRDRDHASAPRCLVTELIDSQAFSSFSGIDLDQHVLST
jgi:hypothetical protein